MLSVTLILIAVTCFITSSVWGTEGSTEKLLHYPAKERQNKEFYRLLTAGFLHADYMHLSFNMITLYFFGPFIERNYVLLFGDIKGRLNFLFLYLFTLILTNLFTYYQRQHDTQYRSLGASGAISGLLFAAILFSPWLPIRPFFFLPIDLPICIWGVLYLVYSSWASRKQFDNVDHGAHFWGALIGMVFTILIKPEVFGVFLEKLMH